MTATLRERTARAVRDDPRSDAELLARFVAEHDQQAFASLVARHGSLVLGVCRRALGATADAEDAVQATFLVLVTKAATIPWRGSLGPWLFGVAHRIARKARFKRDRRLAVEKHVDALPHPHQTDHDATESDDFSRLFDEELAALPDDMRRAVVLCELQGVGRKQAAKQLGISEGTLSSRLGRARKRLRERLEKRGVVLAIPPVVAVSAKLSAAVVGLANESVGVVPAAVFELAQEAIKVMTISKLKYGAVLVAALLGLTGFGLNASGSGEEKPAAKAKAEPAKGQPDAPAKPGPVATVNGQDISREEFGEYLIRKYGAKEIEGYVNQKVIDAEAKKKGVIVTDDELIKQAIKEQMGLFMMGSELMQQMLARQGRSYDTMLHYEILPRMLLRKLCEPTLTVSDEEIRQAFQHKFGERRAVDFVTISNSSETSLSDQVRELIRQGTTDFDDIQKKVPGLSRASEKYSEVRQFPITEPEIVHMFDVIFQLKHIGQIAEIRDPWGRIGFWKLLKILPPEAGKKIEEERAGLKEYVLQSKLEIAIPKLSKKLEKEAKPVYHLPYVVK